MRQADCGSMQCKCTALLQLSPPSLEASFWRSTTAMRTYTRIDVFALVYSLVLNSLLLRMAIIAGVSLSSSNASSSTTSSSSEGRSAAAADLGYILLTSSFLLFYISGAAVQLVLLHKQPAAYKRYRLLVHLANRLLRLGMMFVVARNVSIPDLARPVSESSGLVSQLIAKWPSVFLFRPTAGSMLAFLAHSNMVLPLVVVIPFQLATLVAAMYYMRGVVCWYAPSAEALQLAYGCGQLRRTMRGLGVLLTGMRSLAGFDADTIGSVCQKPVTAAIVVLLFALVVVLVVVPVFATAYLEWSLKHRWVRHELQQHMTWPFPKGVFCGAVVFASWVVSSWFSCELLVSQLPLITCTPESRLLLPLLQS